MLAFIDGPAKDCKGLCIKRAPLLLRVVHSDNGTWDALDQLADKPRYNETLYAYRLVEKSGPIHICSSKHSGWFYPATYRLVEPQPYEETMRYNARWQAWALEQQKREQAPREA